MDKLFIIMPAYNEEKNITSVVEEWIKVVDKIGNDSKLLIVNDGSKDETEKVLSALSLIHPNLLTITKGNEGHGPTLLFGYKLALNSGADYVFQTDSDGQTTTDDFWKFWDDRDKFSAIFGKRPVRGDGKDRKFVENVLCFIIGIIFHIKVPDANAPFRLFEACKLNSYIMKIPEGFNLPNVLLTVMYVKYGEKTEFKPITFRPRQAGVNSINIKKIVKIGMKAVKDFWDFRKVI